MGFKDGSEEGATFGSIEGKTEGNSLGRVEGSSLDSIEGSALGTTVGARVGLFRVGVIVVRRVCGWELKQSEGLIDEIDEDIDGAIL